ncbi:MAG: clostripain-related cysteine peptidase [Methanosarcinaceae archaeon]
MNKLGKLIILLVLIMGLTGCVEDTLISEESPISSEKNDELNVKSAPTLIAVYMAGSDMESGDGAATTDIFEMLDGYDQGQTDRVDVVVAYGGANQDGWRDMKFATLSDLRDDAYDGTIGNEEFFQVIYDLANMGEADSLTKFLKHIRENYDEHRIILVFWNHGGAYEGVCYDENHDSDKLELQEIGIALLGSNLHFDLIGFDACLMGNLEVANTVKDYADYMVASEELEPGHGWDYVSFIGYISNNPEASTINIGEKIIDGFMENPDHTDPIKTLSLLDLSKTDDVIKKLDSLSTGMGNMLTVPEGYSRIGTSITKSQKFGSEPKADTETSIDLKSFVMEIKKQSPDISSSADDLISAIDEFVIYSKHDKTKPNSYGISIFSPKNMDYYHNNYRTVMVSNGWYSFLGSYIDYTTGDVANPEVSKIDDQFYVEDDMGLAAVEVMYFMDDSEGLIMLGTDPAHLNEAGYYELPEWEGEWLYLDDLRTGTYALMSMTYEGITEDEEIIYSAEADLMRDGTTKTVVMDIYRNTDSGEIETYLIPYEILDDEDVLFSKEVLTLQSGDILTTYATLYDENDEEWWIEVGEMTITDDTEYVFDYLPEGTYYYTIYAEDFNGNFEMAEGYEIVLE